MLHLKYKENYSEEEIKSILVELSNLGPKHVMLTGISFNKNELGVMSYNRETKKFFSYFRERIKVKYYGTGDVYASACVGSLLNNKTLEESIKIATDYVWRCINDTYKTGNVNAYGVEFEKEIPFLIKKMKKIT